MNGALAFIVMGTSSREKQKKVLITLTQKVWPNLLSASELPQLPEE
jgi:hypothetical protein